MCIRFECGYYLASVAHKRWEITGKDIQREIGVTYRTASHTSTVMLRLLFDGSPDL